MGKRDKPSVKMGASRWLPALALGLVQADRPQVYTGASCEISSPEIPNPDSQPMSAQHTCKGIGGLDVSPELKWKVVESNPFAHTLVLVVKAVNSSDVHWTVYGMPSTMNGLAKNQPRFASHIQNGALQGRNLFGQAGWDGPCRKGNTQLEFTLHVVNNALDLDPGVGYDKLTDYMGGHTMTSCSFIASFNSTVASNNPLQGGPKDMWETNRRAVAHQMESNMLSNAALEAGATLMDSNSLAAADAALAENAAKAASFAETGAHTENKPFWDPFMMGMMGWGMWPWMWGMMGWW